MLKKKQKALVMEAMRLRLDVEVAADLTSRPDDARRIAADWYTAFERGGKSSTFGLMTQDVAGILMAADDAAPGWSAQARAAEAVGLACALTGEGPGSLRGVEERWQGPSTVGEAPSWAGSPRPMVIGPKRSGKTGGAVAPHTLGTRESGVVSWWPPHDGHLLITGQVGTGKTVAAGRARDHFALLGWAVTHIDGLTLGPAPEIAHLEKIADLFTEVAEEMRRRPLASGSGSDLVEGEAPYLVIIDGLPDLLDDRVPECFAELQERVSSRLAEIIEEGQKKATFVMVTSERPEANQVLIDHQGKFSSRVSLGKKVDPIQKEFFSEDLQRELRSLPLEVRPCTVGLAHIPGDNPKRETPAFFPVEAAPSPKAELRG